MNLNIKHTFLSQKYKFYMLNSKKSFVRMIYTIFLPKVLINVCYDITKIMNLNIKHTFLSQTYNFDVKQQKFLSHKDLFCMIVKHFNNGQSQYNINLDFRFSLTLKLRSTNLICFTGKIPFL